MESHEASKSMSIYNIFLLNRLSARPAPRCDKSDYLCTYNFDVYSFENDDRAFVFKQANIWNSCDVKSEHNHMFGRRSRVTHTCTTLVSHPGQPRPKFLHQSHGQIASVAPDIQDRDPLLQNRHHDDYRQNQEQCLKHFSKLQNPSETSFGDDALQSGILTSGHRSVHLDSSSSDVDDSIGSCSAN